MGWKWADGWRLAEVLLLLALAAAGLPLAVREYESAPAPVDRQPEYEKRALALLAPDLSGIDDAYHVRSSEWVIRESASRPVTTLTAARKALDNARQLEVRLAPAPRWGGLGAWISPYKVSLDSAGRIREVDFHYSLEDAKALGEQINDFDSLRAVALAIGKQGKSEAESRSAANSAAEQAARARALKFAEALGLFLENETVTGSIAPNADRQAVYKEGWFQYVIFSSEQSGERCSLVADQQRVFGFACHPKTEQGAVLAIGLIYFARILLALAALLFTGVIVRRLIRDEWDIAPSLKAGLFMAGLVLLAWPWPFEIRIDLLIWPIAALLLFLVTAASLAAFLGAIRGDSEEAAAPIEGLVTRRALSREVLAALGEGALGAVALLGFMALLDTALFRAGWAHVPFMPEPGRFELSLVPIHWLHELRNAALQFPLSLVALWFFHRLMLWLPQIVGRFTGAVFVAVALGALLGVNPSLVAMAGVALGFFLFSRRLSSGGMMVLLSAVFFWHLVPLALRAFPLGHGGVSAALSALTLVGVMGLGVWGTFRAPSLESGLFYVPGYVTRTKEKNRLQRELEIARSVQLRFLPETAPEVAGVQIAFHCSPAMEVGGDYFDFLHRPKALDIVVGDVSGKGVASAFYMTLAKGILHTLSRLDLSPDEVVRRLNVIFHANSPQGVFITLAYASLELESRNFTYLRAGHNSCLVRRASGKVERLMPPGMIIGFDPGPRFDAGLGSVRTTLGPGDCALLYTDGASEAMNPRGEEYTESRLEKALAVCAGDASATIKAIENAVFEFCDGERQRDDLTLLVVKITE